jgi:hypothetical protein
MQHTLPQLVVAIGAGGAAALLELKPVGGRRVGKDDRRHKDLSLSLPASPHGPPMSEPSLPVPVT